MGILDAPSVPLNAAGQDALATRKSAALRPFHAALANRDYAPCDIVCAGDSLTEGGPVTTGRQRRWVDRLNNQLRGRYPLATPVTGTTGYIPAFYQTFTAGTAATVAGGPLTGYTSGLGNRSSALTTTGQSLTFTFTGTGADLFYRSGPVGGAAVMGVQVDGGAVNNVTLPTAVNTNAQYSIRSLAAGSHTMVVTWVSGAVAVIEGLMPYNGDESKGIRAWEAGRGSSKASDFFSDQVWGPLSYIQPALVTLEWGTNEYMNNAVTSSQFATNLSTVVSKARSKVTVPPTFLFIAFPDPGTSTWNEPWSNFRNVMRTQAAATPNGLFLDFTNRVPAPRVDNSLGLYTNDNVHWGDKGAAYVADVILEYISPK